MENKKNTQLHNAFSRLMKEYASIYDYVKANKDWKNPFRNLISNEIPELIRNNCDISTPYSVVGSYGKGRWTEVPWIAVFDTRITESAQKGAYIVYLLNKDTKKIYLTFEIAATEIIGIRTNSAGNNIFVGVVRKYNSELIEKLQEKADQIRSVIQDNYFDRDSKVSSGAASYDAGVVYYKQYSLDTLPSDDILSQDLKRMMEIYQTYYDWTSRDENSNSDVVKPKEEGGSEMSASTKDTISLIREYITTKGFVYNDKLIENFYLCLKSKPFVILAGTSGTGKTRLVKLFAEAIGAYYKLVPVRPDWSDGCDLFGHYDLNRNFIQGPACECFDYAIEHPKQPVFICLDEMNLARVEYYLSDFLSVIESRERGKDGKIVTSAIAQYGEGIPDNLYFIGTVNMDETTFPFSKKVLDRANTIEFSYVNLIPSFENTEDSQFDLSLENEFLRCQHLILNKDCEDNKDYVESICIKLQELNEILKVADMHVGYRVRDEIVFYMLNNKKADNLLTEDEAMDNEIMQKILPRIQGSSLNIKDMMVDLFKYCFGSNAGIDAVNGELGKEMKKLSSSAKYPRSAEKIGYMMTRYENDGFTSYWL